jgi:ABC-type dipeptide/oligopeptide/nickel transport system ATPase subunit
MNAQAERIFADKPAVREATPLFVGLYGPSGGGKTFSALRVASGIQRVSGGDIYGIDTESRRMLHYADKFKFRHLQFDAPFGSLDYLAAIEHCVRKGGKTIIVDSMSHEHEGPGGVLEQHEAETKRLAAAWNVREEKAQIPAWAAPKQARRRMINTILQINANFVFCFRAKEKLKIISGKSPQELGFMPIAGEEFFFEMTLSCLLLPMSKGVPKWESEFLGERTMMKLPGQFESMFGQPRQLDEDTGQKLAEWSAGTAKPSLLTNEQVEALINGLETGTLEELEVAYRAARETCRIAGDKGARDRVKAAYEMHKSALSAPAAE